MRPKYKYLYDVLSYEECSKLTEHFSPKTKGSGFFEQESKLFPKLTRSSKTCFLDKGSEFEPIIDKVVKLFFDVARSEYGVVLSYIEPIQYAEYGVGGHYKAHTDVSADPSSPMRVLSASVELSKPSDFYGGKLKIFMGKRWHTPPQNQGQVTFFPSMFVHKVTPVLWGKRNSLVLWGTY